MRRIPYGRGWVLVGSMALAPACGDGTGPGHEINPPISGYTAFGQATGVDPETGEQLMCVVAMDELDTGGPVTDTWTGTTKVTVTRLRESASQRVTYDTTIASQDVTLSLLERGQLQLATTGPFADTVVVDVDTTYAGYTYGDWTCGPEHPLSRVQEGMVLTGHWQTQPIFPIE